MSRGEETQEVPQEEGRETSEVQETEARRDAEVVAEPEAVVERERPVEESEAIEAEVVEVMEAAEAAEAAADGGPTTGDREGAAEAATEDGGRGMDDRDQAAASEGEISATPIEGEAELKVPDQDTRSIDQDPQPPPNLERDQVQAAEDRRPEAEGAAVAATEDGGRGTEDRDQAAASEGEISATPMEGEAELKVPDQDTRSIDEDPQPPPNLETDQVQEVPDQVSAAAGAAEEDGGREAEVRVEEIAIKEPVQEDPAIKLPEEEIHNQPESGRGKADTIETDPDRIPEGTDPDIDDDPPPPPDLDGKLADDDLIPGEGDPQQGKPVPADGEGIEDLEGQEGKPVPADDGETEEGGLSPVGEEGEEEEEQEQIDLTAEAAIEEDEYWEPPEIYYHQEKDGTYVIVDKNGKYVKCQPHFMRDPDTGEFQAWYPGAKDKAFNISSFQGYDPKKIMTHTDQDGNVYFYDENYQPLDIQPEFMRNEDGSIVVKNSDGIQVTVENVDTKPFIAQLGVMVYEYPDGSYKLILPIGVQDEWVPPLLRDDEGNYYLEDYSGKQFQVIKINPNKLTTSNNTFVYQHMDGSYSLVDYEGNQLPYPPIVDKTTYSDGSAKFTYKDDQGKVIEIKSYQPPTSGIYAYTSQDGTVYLVDKEGKQVDSPPHYDVNGITGKVTTKGPKDSTIDIPAYEPPIKDIFIHLNQDGSIEIVDQNGNQIDSPPIIEKYVDGDGKMTYYAKYTGGATSQKVALGFYKPPSSHLDKK